MSDFDPYLKWLGIRDTARPINHYRLLGLDLFESDSDVISMAADRQMTHIRTYQSGPNGDISQQILNELARARRCLLVAEKKVEYDAELRASMNTTAPPAITTDNDAPPIVQEMKANPGTQVPSPAVQPTVVPSIEPMIGIIADVDTRAKTKKRESNQLVWTLFGWITGAVAAVGVAAWLINSGWLPNSGSPGEVEDGKTVAANGDQPDARADDDPSLRNAADNNLLKNNGASNEVVENRLPSENNPPPGTMEAANKDTTVAFVPVPGIESKSQEVIFDLANLAKYPKARSDAFRLIGEIKREVPEGKTVRFEPSATQGGSKDYTVVPEDGAILIGLAMTTTNDLVVKTIQPIFFDGLQAGTGTAISSSDSESTSVIAKPGYAVGEIEISAVQPINCFRIKFMKISRTGLDLKDFYLSKWYGREVGPVRKISNERGLPIVGVYGRSDKFAGVATLGLIAMDASVKPVKDPGFFDSPQEPAIAIVQAEFGTGKAATNCTSRINLIILQKDVVTTISTPGLKLKNRRGYFRNEIRIQYRLNDGAVSMLTINQGQKVNIYQAILRHAKEQKNLVAEAVGTPDPGTTAANAEPVVKLPQPSARERSVARKDLPESIQVLIANAKNVNAVMRVARQLVADASLEQDELLKYVVLEEAIRLSETVGDAETAIAAFREIDKSFEIEFWKEAEKSFERAARNPQSLTAFAFKKTMDELIYEARVAKLYDEAGKLLADAIGFSKRANDVESTNAYESLRKEIQELERFAEGGTKAAVVLGSSPDDPKANLDHGNYLFVVQDDVDAAVNRWKNSDDKQWVGLATSELELDSSDPAQVVRLAEMWHELGKNNRTVRDRKCLDRAYELYEQAAKSLNGLAKQSVDYKMGGLRQILKD